MSRKIKGTNAEDRGGGLYQTVCPGQARSALGVYLPGGPGPSGDHGLEVGGVKLWTSVSLIRPLGFLDLPGRYIPV